MPLIGLVQKLTAIIFGGLIATAPPPSPATTPATLDEMLTYECARHVVELAPNEVQRGPVFYREGLVLMSLSFANGSTALLANAGAGQFLVPLSGAGVNRLRFTIPTGRSIAPKTFYLSYSHGGARDSRIYEINESFAPTGREDLDYQPMTAKRATQYLSQLEFAIFETLEVLVSAYSDHRLRPDHIAAVNVRSCDHLTRKSPSLARSLRYNLELLDKATKPDMNRMPASFASTATPFCGHTGLARGSCAFPATGAIGSNIKN